MIEIPEGTRVYGMQLPIQAHSLMIAADWSATPASKSSRASSAHADEHGYHYIGVCDHIALTEDYASRMSTFWQDCIGTLSWAAGITRRTNLLSHAYVLPYRHPLVAAKQFATLDYLSGGRAIVGIGAGHVQPEFERLDVDFNRRGKIVDEKLPVLIDALDARMGRRLRRQPASGATAAPAGVGRGFEPGRDPSCRPARRRLAAARAVRRDHGRDVAGDACGARARR